MSLQVLSVENPKKCLLVWKEPTETWSVGVIEASLTCKMSIRVIMKPLPRVTYTFSEYSIVFKSPVFFL